MSLFSYSDAVKAKNKNITFTGEEFRQISDINKKLRAAVVANEEYVVLDIDDMTENVGRAFKREGWKIERQMGNGVFLTNPPKAIQVGWRFEMP